MFRPTLCAKYTLHSTVLDTDTNWLSVHLLFCFSVFIASSFGMDVVERLTHFFGGFLEQRISRGSESCFQTDKRSAFALLYYWLCLWPVYCSDLFHGSAWTCCLIQLLQHMLCRNKPGCWPSSYKMGKGRIKKQRKQLWICWKKNSRAESGGGP